MSTWETTWLREASAMPNLSGMTNFVNLDDGTARCAACVQGRGRAERHQGEGRKQLEDVVSCDSCFQGN